MNHAEKVKVLASNYAFGFATEFDPQRGKHEEASYHKSWTLFTAAVDKMQAEIDRLTLALNPRKWTQAHSNAWHQHLPDMYAAFEALRSVDEAMKERGEVKSAQDQVITHIQQNLPPLPEGSGDYFLDGDRWVRCADPGPKEQGEAAMSELQKEAQERGNYR